MGVESFTTLRLQAERLTADHLHEVHRMHADPVVMRYLGGPRDEAHTRRYLSRNLQHWDDYGFGLWILRERGGGEPIGRALLRSLMLDGVREVEVGYAFYEPFWGRGLATEVTQACLKLGREALGITRFVALTRPENLGSQRVLFKAGLTYDRDVGHEGTVHRLFRTPDEPQMNAEGEPQMNADERR